MHKTSNHSNRIAGRAVTRSVSVIHFGVGTSRSALGMRPDDWYAHISMLWQKDWQKTLGVGRGGRLTVLGESWLPLRLPFCGIQHRDRNRQCENRQWFFKEIMHPESLLYAFHPLDWWLLWVLRFKSKGINYSNTVQSSSFFLFEPCRKQFHQQLSGWLIFRTARWGLDRLQCDWTVCFLETLRSSAGSISAQPKDLLLSPLSNNKVKVPHPINNICRYDGKNIWAKL